jgi:hypothetical protein
MSESLGFNLLYVDLMDVNMWSVLHRTCMSLWSDISSVPARISEDTDLLWFIQIMLNEILV